MDLRKTAREIGLFETGINLSKVCNSADVLQKVGGAMPLPDENITYVIPQITKWLQSFGKCRYMFLNPELAIIEGMSNISMQADVIITIPCDLEEAAKERLRNNLPHNINVTILEEPYFPQSFYPGNGLMVVCGYSAGERLMVLPDVYRMVEHYSGFLGKKVFIPYKEIETSARYDGWLELSQQRISARWRSET